MTSRPDRPRLHTAVLVLAVSVGAAAAMTIPLISEKYRPWNFAAFGAIALFVAARGGKYGFPLALAVTFGLKVVSDLLNYYQHGYDRDYLPMFHVYVGYAFYALFGWMLLRNTENPVKIGGAAFLSSVLYFLFTNFVDWVKQSLPYPMTFGGLTESYWMGIPFWRGGFFGDLAFGGILFSLHAVVVRLPLLSAKTARIPVQETSGSESR